MSLGKLLQDTKGMVAAEIDNGLNPRTLGAALAGSGSDTQSEFFNAFAAACKGWNAPPCHQWVYLSIKPETRALLQDIVDHTDTTEAKP